MTGEEVLRSLTTMAEQVGKNSVKPGIDYPGVAAIGIVIHPDDLINYKPLDETRFIITLRGPQARHSQGTWEVPGGKIEFKESAKDAFIREVKEETGLGLIENSITQAGFFDDFISDNQHWVSLVFVALAKPGEVKLEPGKTVDYSWISFRNFFENNSKPLMKNVDTAVGIVYDYFSSP